MRSHAVDEIPVSVNINNMCEVIRSSFENLFPLIERTIKQADFIAIDSEFTGLHVKESDKPSLFDTSEERYRKMRNNVSQLTLCQIALAKFFVQIWHKLEHQGISAFVKNKTDSVYMAHTFNFPLCPMAFGPLDTCFSWQASSLEFLSRFNFDFNRCVYEGVSFLNDEQEKQLCQALQSGSVFDCGERYMEKTFIQSLCSLVAKWYISSKEGETYTLHKTNADAKLWNEFVIHTEIRRRFPEVWTVTDSFKNIAVQRVSLAKRKELEEEKIKNQEQEKEMYKLTLLGFTRVFRVMREYQKVLVGHNMLMDLVFLYDKFFRPLPSKYSTFKRDLHDLFPRVYDTKHMSFNLRKIVEEMAGTFSTNLVQLYRILSSEKVTNCEMHMPSVVHATGFERYKTQDAPHEAGFDAYLCGYTFLRMSHILHNRSSRKSLTQVTGTCPFRIYLESLSTHVNCINMIRATLNHIQLDGKDPPCLRPQQLFVCCRQRGQKLNRQLLTQWMSGCGTVDIRFLSPSTAVVAAGNFNCARVIMSTFKGHRVISVCKYRFWKHSPVAKTLLWCGLVVSGGVCAWAVVSLIRGTD